MHAVSNIRTGEAIDITGLTSNDTLMKFAAKSSPGRLAKRIVVKGAMSTSSDNMSNSNLRRLRSTTTIWHRELKRFTT